MTNGTKHSFLNLPSDILSATQFLSRLPVHILPGQDKTNAPAIPDFSKTAYAFPLAGLIIAIPAASVLWTLSFFGLPHSATAVVTIGILILITGALHEDGLADVADGFWGGHDKVRKLEIMRDSSIGTYGTLALILSVGLKISLLTGLLTHYSPLEVAFLYLAVAALSRGAMLWPWISLLPVRPSTSTNTSTRKDEAGLSARYGSPDKEALRPLLVCSMPASVLLLAICGSYSLAIALILAGLCIYLMTNLARCHIGGHTGDVLGATQQMSELGLLIGLATTI